MNNTIAYNINLYYIEEIHTYENTVHESIIIISDSWETIETILDALEKHYDRCSIDICFIDKNGKYVKVVR